MRALESLKERCVVGARCLFSASWCKDPALRMVTGNYTLNAALMDPEMGVQSFLEWPKPTEITEPEPGLFEIKYEDCHEVLTYDFRA